MYIKYVFKAFVRTEIHECVHRYVSTYIYTAYIHTHACIHTYIHTHMPGEDNIHACINTTHIHTYTHMHTRIFIHTYIHTYILQDRHKAEELLQYAYTQQKSRLRDVDETTALKCEKNRKSEVDIDIYP
jgi:hypothetical protein